MGRVLSEEIAIDLTKDFGHIRRLFFVPRTRLGAPSCLGQLPILLQHGLCPLRLKLPLMRLERQPQSKQLTLVRLVQPSGFGIPGSLGGVLGLALVHPGAHLFALLALSLAGQSVFAPEHLQTADTAATVTLPVRDIIRRGGNGRAITVMGGISISISVSVVRSQGSLPFQGQGIIQVVFSALFAALLRSPKVLEGGRVSAPVLFQLMCPRIQHLQHPQCLAVIQPLALCLQALALLLDADLLFQRLDVNLAECDYGSMVRVYYLS